MQYIETKLVFSPFTSENHDIIVAMLADGGYDSFSELPNGILAYIPASSFSNNLPANLLEPVSGLFEHLEITSNKVAEVNWNAEWEKNFAPIYIGTQCSIIAPFHNIDENFEHIIIIEPKMSFGTGHHATTALMVTTMLDMALQNKSVLDMGCGTGVLAILAGQMRANPILAIDIDNWAYENTLENIARNHQNNIEVALGGANIIGIRKFDVILANINRNILLADMAVYVNALNQNGLLLMSGFYETDLPLIRQKAESMGLNYLSHLEKETWVAALFKK